MWGPQFPQAIRCGTHKCEASPHPEAPSALTLAKPIGLARRMRVTVRTFAGRPFRLHCHLLAAAEIRRPSPNRPPSEPRAAAASLTVGPASDAVLQQQPHLPRPAAAAAAGWPDEWSVGTRRIAADRCLLPAAHPSAPAVVLGPRRWRRCR